MLQIFVLKGLQMQYVRRKTQHFCKTDQNVMWSKYDKLCQLFPHPQKFPSVKATESYHEIEAAIDFSSPYSQ